MIQRIQSLFLFVAAASCIVAFLFPISGNLTQEGASNFYELYLYVLKVFKPGVKPDFDYLIAIPMAGVMATIFILSVVTIFNFKKRMRQMMLVKISVFLNILLIVGIYFGYTRLIENRIGFEGVFDIGAFFPLISLVFLILAFRRISHDEKLIRSTDRLR